MNDEIRIAVCEDIDQDKNHLVNLLAEYLDKNELIAKIDTYSSGESFLAADTSVYALVFFDIYMDQLNGMETAKRLIEKNKSVQLVFCSTSRDFAAESYDVSALHYLLKPVERDKLFRVLDRFFDGIRHLKTINVKVGRTEETVYLKDIIYLESNNKKTIVHTVHGKIEAGMPLSYFCRELKEPSFVKPIRYALVPVSQIVKVPAETVTLSDGTVLPVSRAERKHVKDVFADYKWKTAFAEKGGRE